MRGRLCAVAKGGALVLAGMDTYRLDEAEQPVELLGEDPGRRIEEQTFVSAVLGWLAAREQVEGPAGEREDDEAGMAEEEEPEMMVYSYGSTSLLLNIDWSVAGAGAARCGALKSNSIQLK